jgi:hypothetical protein
MQKKQLEILNVGRQFSHPLLDALEQPITITTQWKNTIDIQVIHETTKMWEYGIYDLCECSWDVLITHTTMRYSESNGWYCAKKQQHLLSKNNIGETMIDVLLMICVMAYDEYDMIPFDSLPICFTHEDAIKTIAMLKKWLKHKIAKEQDGNGDTHMMSWLTSCLARID